MIGLIVAMAFGAPIERPCIDASEEHPYYCKIAFDADVGGALIIDAASQPEDELGFAFAVEGEVLTAVVRWDDAGAHLCCTIQEPLDPIADGFRGASFRIDRLKEATLSLAPLIRGNGFIRFAPSRTWVGPNGRAAPQKAELDGVVHDFLILSDALDEQRRIEVYLPPGFKPERSWPLMVLGDGERTADYAGISSTPPTRAGFRKSSS
ncbi:MAG: hypothetical protein ACFB2Z_08975 [Maricaulaceae bacterium]